MQPLHTPAQPSGTAAWPLWVLLAALPLALALGFISGMAAATYLPSPAVPPAVTAAPSLNQATGTPTAPDQSQPPSNPAVDNDAGQVWKPSQPLNVPQTLPTSPSLGSGYDGARMRDIRDARAELARSFARYQAEGAVIPRIDYQQMRNVGTGVSLVGLLSVDAYNGWTRALQTDPAGLKTWLESATRNVLPAMERDRFAVSWAVVDVRPERPAGFADYEATPLDNGSFLVIRPLASTIDPGEPTIALRLAPDPKQPPGLRPPTSAPWATYGPILRFDTTDLYRPLGTAGTKPK